VNHLDKKRADMTLTVNRLSEPTPLRRVNTEPVKHTVLQGAGRFVRLCKPSRVDLPVAAESVHHPALIASGPPRETLTCSVKVRRRIITEHHAEAVENHCEEIDLGIA
jgi:hypothetical protein